MQTGAVLSAVLIAASCLFAAGFVLSAIGASRPLREGGGAALQRRLLFVMAAASALAAAGFAVAAGLR